MKIKMIMRFMMLVSISACTTTSNLPAEKTKWRPRLQIQAGINKGGITENRDFSSTSNTSVDGFSGATRSLGPNAGAHIILPLKRNAVETGIDFMYNKQTFKYNDPIANYVGYRGLGVSQFMLPITYNIGLFKMTNKQALCFLKLGYLVQYNSIDVTDSGQNLPTYSYNHWSEGITLGLSSTPIVLKNGTSIGVYFDVYRGSKIYDDVYNNDTYKMPGSSFMKFGLIYQLK
jgi:hypothetical protein